MPSSGATTVVRRDLWVYAAYFFLVVLIARTPSDLPLKPRHVPGGRIDVFAVAGRLFDHSIPAMAPDADRPLASLLIVYTARLPGVPDIQSSYTVWRFLCLFTAVVLLDRLMRRWLSPAGAFASVLFYLLGFACAGFDDKPDGWFEQFFYAAGFSAVAAGRLGLLLATVAVGTFARESLIFLAGAYFLVWARRDNWTRAFVHSVAVLAAWCVSWALVHHLVGHVQYYSELWRLPRNIRGLANYLAAPWQINCNQYRFFGILGVLWVLPFLPRPRGPEFLERVKWLLPASLICTLQLAKIWEVRVFYYHVMYLAPLAVWKLFPSVRRG